MYSADRNDCACYSPAGIAEEPDAPAETRGHFLDFRRKARVNLTEHCLSYAFRTIVPQCKILSGPLLYGFNLLFFCHDSLLSRHFPPPEKIWQRRINHQIIMRMSSLIFYE